MQKITPTKFTHIKTQNSLKENEINAQSIINKNPFLLISRSLSMQTQPSYQTSFFISSSPARYKKEQRQFLPKFPVKQVAVQPEAVEEPSEIQLTIVRNVVEPIDRSKSNNFIGRRKVSKVYRNFQSVVRNKQDSPQFVNVQTIPPTYEDALTQIQKSLHVKKNFRKFKQQPLNKQQNTFEEEKEIQGFEIPLLTAENIVQSSFEYSQLLQKSLLSQNKDEYIPATKKIKELLLIHFDNSNDSLLQQFVKQLIVTLQNSSIGFNVLSTIKQQQIKNICQKSIKSLCQVISPEDITKYYRIDQQKLYEIISDNIEQCELEHDYLFVIAFLDYLQHKANDWLYSQLFDCVFNYIIVNQAIAAINQQTYVKDNYLIFLETLNYNGLQEADFQSQLSLCDYIIQNKIKLLPNQLNQISNQFLTHQNKINNRILDAYSTYANFYLYKHLTDDENILCQTQFEQLQFLLYLSLNQLKGVILSKERNYSNLISCYIFFVSIISVLSNIDVINYYIQHIRQEERYKKRQQHSHYLEFICKEMNLINNSLIQQMLTSNNSLVDSNNIDLTIYSLQDLNLSGMPKIYQFWNSKQNLNSIICYILQFIARVTINVENGITIEVVSDNLVTDDMINYITNYFPEIGCKVIASKFAEALQKIRE
ncbi:Hypothetical_protein [Hexamita inflata]|uniref:Hypothetical_protein n=1 Tax=Hexamita inflata TaxID=28002 RepID=A0AA86QSX2_9EUKA|nr:Hypothetical protein HINF_LOCUS51088 [Hexamita inflata]